MIDYNLIFRQTKRLIPQKADICIVHFVSSLVAKKMAFRFQNCAANIVIKTFAVNYIKSSHMASIFLTITFMYVSHTIF